jgi:sugar (pentulose or hexulose) kinase
VTVTTLDWGPTAPSRVGLRQPGDRGRLGSVVAELPLQPGLAHPAQGEGYIYESVLRSGSFLFNWFVDQFVPEGRKDPTVFGRLVLAAQEIPIGCDGLLIQPYWSGVMDPNWDVSARGVTFGQSGSHKLAHYLPCHS